MDKEALELLELILKRSFYTVEDAQYDTSSTVRQVMYRLEKINQLLKIEKKSRIIIGNQKEFLIDRSTKDYLIQLIFSTSKNLDYHLDREERKLFLVLCMFIGREYLSLQHLISLMRVSKSTVLQDLSELRYELSQKEICIQYNREYGYYLESKEINLRKHTIKLIIESLSKNSNSRVFDMVIDSQHLYTFDFSKLIIHEIASKYGINFVEERLNEFIYLFIFLTTRIIECSDSINKNYDIPEVKMIEAFIEFEFTNDLIDFFPFRTEVSKIDREYISAWIIGISVGNVETCTVDYEIIASITKKIINRFEQLSGMRFKKSSNIFKLIYAHLRPAYYRMVFKLPIINPLKDKIKKEYGSLYYLVQETMRILNNIFDEEISDDELAYITIHFASIYLREGIEQKDEKKKALIICLHGIGSSIFLYNELSALFPSVEFLKPIGISQFNKEKYDVDIIFTTKYFKEIAHSDIPFVKVNPVMDLKEKNEVNREASLLLGNLHASNISRESIVNIVRKHLGNVPNEEQLVSDLFNLSINEPKFIQREETRTLELSDMIDENLINLQVYAKTVEEALQLSGELLVAAQKISIDYVHRVIQEQKEHPAYFIIAPNIALPHVKPNNNVYETSLSVVTLEEPIIFEKASNNPVSIILFLAAKDDASHINAMSSLLELLNNQEFIELVKKTKDKETILNYINGTYS